MLCADARKRVRADCTSASGSGLGGACAAAVAVDAASTCASLRREIFIQGHYTARAVGTPAARSRVTLISVSPGDRVGPYEILSALGAGGMGEVFKATDTRLGRTVAIKFLKGAHSERFEREARAIAALNHPHICALYDIGPDYLVMEYVEGAPLKGPVPPLDAARHGRADR